MTKNVSGKKIIARHRIGYFNKDMLKSLYNANGFFFSCSNLFVGQNESRKPKKKKEITIINIVEIPNWTNSE